MMCGMASSPQQFETLNVQLLVDSIPALIHTARPDGYLDYFNKPWLEYLGVPLDDVMGWNWKAFIHPEDLEGIVTKWRASLATGEIFEYETRVRKANGEYRWMFHRKVPLRDAHGNIVKWYGSSLDIDERKTAEEQLRRNGQELQRSEFYLAEGQRLAHMGSWVFKPAGFFSHWSRELFQIHGLDSTGEAPSLEEYLATVHPLDREFMRSRIHQMVAEASGCDVTKRIVRSNGEVRHIRCVGAPVVEAGVLQAIIGTAIDVTEHELLTQELRLREAYLAEAQRLSHTGSFGWNVSTGEIFWSDETFRIFEFAASCKPSLQMILERVHPQDMPSVEMAIAAATRGEAIDLEYRQRMPDGRIKYLHIVGKPASSETGGVAIIGAVMDVTARKMTEVELRRSKAHLTDAQRLSRTGSVGMDVSTKRIFWSEESARIYGYPPGTEPTSALILRRVHPDDVGVLKDALERAAQGGNDFDFEHRLLMPDGSIKHIYNLAHGLKDEAGNEEVVGAMMDITERKAAEAKIREQEIEVRQILDLTPQLVAVFGSKRERLYVNRVALNYLGASLEQWRQCRTGAEIHPDDFERFKAYADRAVASGSGYELELRLRKGDGSYRWFLARYNPVRDNQGQITRWYVACTDIEDRKKMEERLQLENVALREEIAKVSMFEEIVGTSPALKIVLSRISKVAPSDSTVLLLGETGTGKELVARAIHRRSDRSAHPFVSVNCAAVPRDLIASELFGHEKGAFTGATHQRLGRFELATGGTIFLDEVGELPIETQIALLRVLQEQEFERIGGNRPIHTNVRVIAATNRDLQAAIQEGLFRSDLFYRLHVFPIDIPPLRERCEDIPLLVEYFIDRYARKAGKNIRGVNKRTLQLLESYPWPGNIRELQNVIERSVILCDSEIFSIDESWLPQQSLAATEAKYLTEFPRKLLEQEKNMIEAALKECKGRVYGPKGAAAKLGIPRSTLESKIRSLKINKNRFRA
jgi:formate hydrogenlyase transcriptional activator